MNIGVEENMIAKIKLDFSESSLPYFVDLANYPTLEHSAMKEHIDRVGVVFYKK